VAERSTEGSTGSCREHAARGRSLDSPRAQRLVGDSTRDDAVSTAFDVPFGVRRGSKAAAALRERRHGLESVRRPRLFGAAESVRQHAERSFGSARQARARRPFPRRSDAGSKPSWKLFGAERWHRDSRRPPHGLDLLGPWRCSRDPSGSDDAPRTRYRGRGSHANRWSWLKTLEAGKGQERIQLRFAAKT